MQTAKLCVTVTGQSMAELRRRRDEVTDADLVEVRLDTARDPSAAAAVEGRRLPVIVTCRPEWEGGAFRGSEEERHRILLEAQQLGAEFVDVEWKSHFADVVQAHHGRGVVLSMHDFTGTPDDLTARTRAMRSTGAEVVKVAVMAERLCDCLKLLPLTDPSAGDAVLIAMGAPGLPTRVLAARFGSRWTYAGDAIAPGQVPARRLREEFGFGRATASTAVFGVVGRPVLHSLSPAMHNGAFDATRLDAVVLPLAAQDYDDFLQFAEGMSLQGASVTAPFKLIALERAQHADDISRRIGSANTLRRRDAGWQATNTDSVGFIAPLLSAAIDVRSMRATILGAGGAARAAAAALHDAGALVTIAARRASEAQRLAEAMSCRAGEFPPAPQSWDLLINATPVGTAPAVEETPLPGYTFAGELVYDLVYNPPQTRLLRDAARSGCRTIGGLEMLIAQAMQQFEWWTGHRPSPHVMRDAALNALDAAAASRPAGNLT
jgi:3-dehydroquinate dehydratase/shikimate dehydrogenase